jgi:cytochrome b
MMSRRIIDAGMTASLLFLMAYQVTGEALHEWIGIAMTALVIVHQILNRKWYSSVFKGKYNPYRIMTTAVNILLLLSFAMTALSGMSMSAHAVPFLYGMAPVSLVRKMHLAMSHWSFVLMGLHIGLHIPVMTAKMKMAASCAIAGLVSDEERCADYIMPKAFDKRVGPAVAAAVAEAERKSGVARI